MEFVCGKNDYKSIDFVVHVGGFMSAIYNEFKNMDSETAFLVGGVSTLSDQTLCRIIPRYWAVEADVFKTDMEHLLTTVKSRLSH